MCAARGFKLIVCPLTGQMTFRVYVPQALERRDLYSDPVALKWERRYLDYFVRRMRHHGAIAAWESGNETNCLGPIASPDAVEAWLALIHGTIRLADGSRPIIGPNSLEITDGKWRVDRIAALSDVLTVHPYQIWSNAYLDDGNGIRNCQAEIPFPPRLAFSGKDHSARRCVRQMGAPWRPDRLEGVGSAVHAGKTRAS